MSQWNPDKIRLNIARDLRRVGELYDDLHWQALAAYVDRDFPGGRALNMMGPSADPSIWESQYEAAESEIWNSDDSWAQFSDYANDQLVSEEHPLYVLEQWTRIIREERGQPTGLKATLSRESSYLSKSLDWMSRVDQDGLIEWPEVFELSKDLRRLVRSMENALAEGDRLDASASACFQDDDDSDTGRCGGRLVRRTLRRRKCEHVKLAEQFADEPAEVSVMLRAMLVHVPRIAKAHKSCDQGGRDDVYKCLKCEKIYTNVEYWLAVKDHYERQAG